MATKYLKDYLPPAYTVKETNLRFDLGDDETLVRATLLVDRHPETRQAGGPLRLDGEALDLRRAAVNGRELSLGQYLRDEASLTIPETPQTPFTLETTVAIRPQDNTTLMGLYKSGGSFCTQCEPEGFRRITYYLDRPDVMAVFTTTITADKARFPRLLSNGNPVETRDLDGGRHLMTWRDPFPKPSYLFALVAGDLAEVKDTFTTMSGRTVDLSIYVQHHNAHKCGHAMASIKKSFAWDEEAFGREYDLDRFMLVAVDDFNFGAMENKGLNIFNSKYVLAMPETATDQDYDHILGVIGHEYFHNWSGDRVTLRDWFQLSLKEGFTVFRDQSFSADMTSAAAKRIDDVVVLRTQQFKEDASPLAHPVRPPSYEAIDNFYTATVYEKGAEVVRMLHTLLGPETFRRACDLYFARNDGRAACVEDFVAAMEQTSGRDLSVFMRWYSQAGTPDLRVTDDFDPAAQTYTLHLRQHTAPTPGQDVKQPFHIPVRTGLLAGDGNPLAFALSPGETPEAAELVLELTEEVRSFTFHGVREKPVPSLLRHFSAPVKLDYDYDDQALAFLMAHDQDLFNRWEAGQRLCLRLLLDLVARVKAGREMTLPSPVVDAFRSLLTDPGLDPRLAAAALRMPDEIYLGQQMEEIDPDAIHAARGFAVRSLAAALEPEFCAVYQRLDDGAAYQVSQEAIGRRELKNAALAYLTATRTPEAFARCMRQFNQADNMTDQESALAALSHCDCPQRIEALARFYDRWRQEPLVVDKWFAIQALSGLPQVLDQVKVLTAHEAFSMANPNRVRSLVGAFCGRNQAGFHHKSGEGYRLLADFVMALNATNPLVASMMMKQFGSWRRFDEGRRHLMQQQMERVKGTPGLSTLVAEVTHKMLD